MKNKLIKPKSITKKYPSRPTAVAYVNFKDNENKPKRKYFDTHKEAQIFADDLNFKAEKFGKQARNIDDTDTQDLILAKNNLQPLGISFKEAIKNYIELSEVLKDYKTDIRGAVNHFVKWNDKKAQSISLDKAINEYMLALKSTGQGKHHIRTQEPRLKRFMNDFKPSFVVAMIEPTKIEKWLSNLSLIEYIKPKDKEALHIRKETNKAASPTTKNNYRRTLSAFFSYCVRKDYIKDNPIKKVATIKEAQEEPEIYSVNELATMLYSSKELSQERLFIALGAFAGLRVAELHKVTWDKIHFDEKEIVVDASITKTSQRRIVEISDNLLEWLKPYISQKLKGGLLFPSENILRNALEKFREANNITWIDNGLRHSSASYHLAQSQNANLTAERMGHSVSMLKKHYMGLVRQADAKSYWNIYPKAKTSVIDASNILKESIA